MHKAHFTKSQAVWYWLNLMHTCKNSSIAAFLAWLSPVYSNNAIRCLTRLNKAFHTKKFSLYLLAWKKEQQMSFMASCSEWSDSRKCKVSWDIWTDVHLHRSMIWIVFALYCFCNIGFKVVTTDYFQNWLICRLLPW